MKKLIKSIPVVGVFARYINHKFLKPLAFRSSGNYWEKRYRAGGNSGLGSYDRLAEFKADFLNGFVREKQIVSVIEFGFGDGNQLSLSKFPKYTGYDVSKTALYLCKKKFSGDLSKSFRLMNEYSGEKADLSMSLDVIYHLIEDEVFHDYMSKLFTSSERFVIIYSSNMDEKIDGVIHVRHRKFTDWVKSNEPNWKLVEKIKNKYPYQPGNEDTSFADFYVYQIVSKVK